MFQQEISVTLTSHSTQYVGKPNNKSSKTLPEMSGINHLQMEGYGIGLTTIVVSPILVGKTKHWERPNQPGCYLRGTLPFVVAVVLIFPSLVNLGQDCHEIKMPGLSNKNH